MATRVTAASLLLVSALVAWVTITLPLAARVLQLSVLLSMLYVAYLAWRGGRVIRRAMRGVREPTGLATDLPFVSFVVPARNEASVIGATVARLRDLRYAARDGTPAFELLVVDDGSTDETGERARAAATGAGHVMVRRREPGSGQPTKGGVLAFALPFLRGNVIGVIDADTWVEPAFLERAMAAWRRDPGAVALQVARRARNASASWLTRAQGDEQLMDLASQCGRRATDGTAELRGNGMFVRRDVLESVGGWGERALTEDLELSTRLSVAGEHVALAPEVAVEEEAVEGIGPLWRQRLRWAEGSLRRLLEHGPTFVAGPHAMSRKMDFVAFAAEFLVPPLFVSTILASLVSIPVPGPAEWTVPISLAIGYGLGVFLLALGGLWGMDVAALPLLGRAARGALFLSHWLLVVPAALVRIACWREPAGFVQTPRFTAPDR